MKLNGELHGDIEWVNPGDPDDDANAGTFSGEEAVLGRFGGFASTLDCCRKADMAKRTCGKTASGLPITDELVNELEWKAEAGYDVEEMLRRRSGRPPMGSAAASVESLRLDPELRKALSDRALRDRETTSSTIRKALPQAPQHRVRQGRSRAPAIANAPPSRFSSGGQVA